MAIPRQGIHIATLSVLVLATALLVYSPALDPSSHLYSAYKTMSSTFEPQVHIAIIGAGSAGLAALKQILDAFARAQTLKLHIVVYESNEEVGGVW